MSIQYSFRVTNINCYPQYQSLENVVFWVLWEYVGVDGEYLHTVTGNTAILYDPNTEYKPYEELTEAEVIRWIQQNTDPQIITDAQALIQQRINEYSQPITVINPKLPWQ